jgi:rare lipoprotein A
MTGVHSIGASRGLGVKATREFNIAATFVRGSFLAAAIVCASGVDARANSIPFTITSHGAIAPKVQLTSLLAITNRSAIQTFMSHFECPPALAILNSNPSAPSLDDVTGSVPGFRFDLPSPKPTFPIESFFLASLTPPASVDADSAGSPIVAPELITGIASMYNPIHPDETKDDGGAETASGELYDEEGWTAAIRTDLRDLFGGVHYGKNYQAAYALVESGSKRAIVKVNDVGPLKPGRIIDLNQRTMRYFDPTLQLGLLKDVSVTPLPGTDWTAGPVGGGEDTIQVAGGFAP